MNTRQHTALFTMQLASKFAYNHEEFKRQLRLRLPFVLLPDAICGYVGSRQMSHFEATPDGTDTSWMEFPSTEVLSHLSKDTVEEKVHCYMAKSYSKCVVGEDTKIGKFDHHNYAHQHYHDLRVHIVQDICMDRTMRKNMVSVKQRFEDCYTVHHNHSIVLDGIQLREQIARFEELGFIHLCGKVHESTGMLLDGNWFDQYVLGALIDTYPEDLANSTYRYMKFSKELDKRIKTMDFTITDEEKASVVITDDLIRTLDKLYAEAGWYTYQEI